MTTRNLDKLFAPKSIAIIGATNRPGAIGNIVTRNVLQGGFDGPVMPVHPKRDSVAGILAYRNVENLPMVPDLAIICTPPEPIPGIVATLGARGTRAAIVITAGLEAAKTPEGVSVAQAMLDAARPHLLRILGPNCVGALIPGIGVNASFAHLPALPGGIAFASQSGALCTAVLDWARMQKIGFSHFISLGNMADIDFGDVVDYLASDPKTTAILLYIEAVTNGRKFMSACRAAARNKPVVVIKSGTAAEGAAAAATHTGALAGADRVYDAAFRRAGLLRVGDFGELFAAVETLARARPQSGERLAILTNGGGLGVMAIDELVRQGGVSAKLRYETIAALNAVLPATWSHRNPVDIIGDAPGSRYADAIRILAESGDSDAVLVMHAPVATADPAEAARAVLDVAGTTSGNILTNWVGGEAIAPARKLFQDAGVPTYQTPGQAVDAFMHMVRYRRNQDTLMETPASTPDKPPADSQAVRGLVEKRLAAEVDMMNEVEAKAVLAAYGIPAVETRFAATPHEAADIADELGYPVALKIVSDQVSHKSDAGGVKLSLESAEAVTTAAETMLENVARFAPGASLEGFSVQPMISRPHAYEVVLGMTQDPVFGPVLLFGHGGTAVEVIDDTAVALPPLNMKLAKDLIDRTRISRLLAGYRNRPAVDMDRLCQTLIQLSQLVVDIPEILEVDINPMLVDESGLVALDARIRVVPAAADRTSRLAIRPYPDELVQTAISESGDTVLIRPVRPEDEADLRTFLASLPATAVDHAAFGLSDALAHLQIARLTQIDYDREMVFVAQPSGVKPPVGMLGLIRSVTDPDNETSRLAIAVAPDKPAMADMLLARMIDYCRMRGTARLMMMRDPENEMQDGLLSPLGFRKSSSDSESYDLAL